MPKKDDFIHILHCKHQLDTHTHTHT